MKHVIARIKEQLDEGDYYNALRRCHHILRSGHPQRLTYVGKKYREALIELIHGSGLFEEILATEEAELKEGGTNFSVIYELYKFESLAFGEVSLRVMEAMATFYENREDRMASLGWSEHLLEEYEKQGRDDLLEEAHKRVKKNLALLSEKAINYQETGEHRYAFNSCRCLLESDFNCYKYHLGYLFNALKSGKPEEAYKTILKEKVHRDYILEDDKLQELFYDLAHIVATDEERPDVLQ